MKNEIKNECSKTYKINIEVKTYGECSVYGFNILRYIRGIFRRRKGFKNVQIDLINMDLSEEEQ